MEPVVDGLPRPKPLGQVAPRDSCLRPIEDGINKEAVATLGLRPSLGTWEHGVKKSPLLIG